MYYSLMLVEEPPTVVGTTARSDSGEVGQRDFHEERCQSFKLFPLASRQTGETGLDCNNDFSSINRS